MAEIVPAFFGAEPLKTFAKERPQRLNRATARRADDRLELREAEFDRIEIGAVRRQIQQRGARPLDRLSHARDFVGTEIVRNNHVAGAQGRDEDLFDVREEARPVDRAVEDPGGGEPGDAKGGEERTGFPAPERRVVVDAHAPRGAPVTPEQIRGDARFVEKDQVRQIPRRRLTLPVGSGDGDVRLVVLAGAYGFF
jgi:hypothetical protein